MKIHAQILMDHTVCVDYRQVHHISCGMCIVCYARRSDVVCRVNLERSDLERSSPSARTLFVEGDIRDVNFVVFPPPLTYSVRGHVATDMQWRQHLTVELADAHSPSTPIATKPLGPAAVFEFSGLQPGRYAVTLRADGFLRTFRTSVTALPSQLLPNVAAVDVPVESDVLFTFEANPRDAHHELTPAPFFVLLCGILLGLAVWRRSQVMAFVRWAVLQYQSVVAKRGTAGADAPAARGKRTGKPKRS